MKRMFLAGVSALAVVTALSTANAADLARRHMPVKAPVYTAPGFNWTGFYVGINGGGAFGRSDWTNPLASTGAFNVSGAMAGGTVGYNWQAGRIVYGIEGDLDWSGVKGSTTTNCVGGCEFKNDWLGTVRGRVGYAFERVLPYVTGGLAVGDLKASTVLGSSTETRAGWTAGAGLEAAITGPLTAKIEYLYADLGKASCPAGICATGVATDVDYHTNIVRAGLNYHF